MAKLFSYKTLDLEILSSSKSAALELRSTKITPVMILELEHFFSWLCNHIEVYSVLISGKGKVFSEGLDLLELSKLSNTDIATYLEKFQKIIYLLFFLPQMLIFDLKEKAFGAGAEFSIGGDLRIAPEGVDVKFNHLENALTPACGGIGFLEAIIPHIYVRNWILTGESIGRDQLISSGFIHSFYNDQNPDYGKDLLIKIAKTSPVARIQAKRTLLEPLLLKLENSLKIEPKFFMATLNINDWRKVLNKGNENFCSAKDLSALLAREAKSIN